MKHWLPAAAFGAAAIAVLPVAVQAAPQGAETASAGAAVGEVVVTARRREERLQDVPLSIQAFSQTALAARGVERVQDLERQAPTLRITPTSSRRNSSAVELRGIGSVETSVTQDTPIAFYLNEVVESRPIGVNQSLFDVSSVQVLKGPQGTLFGRNATAGAVLITTNRPTAEFGGELGLTVGDYKRRDESAIVNLPVTQGLALRLAAQHLQRDGYTRNITNGVDLDDESVTTLRLSALVNPTPQWDDLLVVDYYDSKSNGTGSVLGAIRPCSVPPGSVPGRQPLATCSPVFAAPLAAAFAAQQALGIRNVAYNFPTQESASSLGVSNLTTIHLNEALTVKNVAGFRHIQLGAYQDSDATPLSLLAVGLNSQVGHQVSEELQLQGDYGRRLNFIVGAFYFRERNEELSTSFQLGSPISSINNAVAQNTSASVFAQATFGLPVDDLSLTVGGRYTHDKRDADLLSRTGAGTCRLVTAANVPISPCSRPLSVSYNVPTWNVSLEYRPSSDLLVYVAHRRGYRAGGFNIRATSPLQSTAFDPEHVTDVEFGAKTTGYLGSMRYQADLAVYKSWYDDIQRTVAQLFNGVLVSGVFNSADAQIKGLEADVTVEPIRSLSLSGSWGYVDAEHTRFESVVAGQPVLLRHVPFGQAKHTLVGSLTWTPVDSELGTVSATVSVSARSPWYPGQVLPDLEPEARVGWQQQTNLSVDWRHVAGSPVSLQALVRNLFDQAYVQSELSQAGSFGFVNRVYGEPRMFSLKLTYAFGAEDRR